MKTNYGPYSAKGTTRVQDVNQDNTMILVNNQACRKIIDGFLKTSLAMGPSGTTVSIVRHYCNKMSIKYGHRFDKAAQVWLITRI